jgi:hypothetical protein
MERRALLLAALLLPVAARAQERAPPRNRASDFWFDPTQLPAFTGTVERYLINTRGETDALLFREGAQVVFPPEFGQSVRDAVPVGRTIIVWGIRARQAPVITMLAFAPNAEVAPVVVERVYWRLLGRSAAERAALVAAQGTVKVPYFTPQGEIAGAILEDGTVVTVPAESAEPLRALLQPGAKLAAEGRGVANEQGRALAAERIGENEGALRPVPVPAPAPAPARQN